MFNRLPELGKNLINENIINSPTHIFGIKSPVQEDIQNIRSLIVEECKI